MKNIFIIVPTYNPDEIIMDSFVEELHQEFENILVVNDGSNSKHNNFFEKLSKKGIKVINHYRNLGKGRGLKNALNYLLNHYTDIDGVVTCDCDGQHSVKDIKKCAKSLLKNKDKLILGVRNFEKQNVPKKSKFGNKITRNIFKLFIGLNITDTQTGLRAFSKELMIKFLSLPGERYEYETNMLINCKEESILIEEVEIETIYLNNNSNSHFNPLKDSILIYKLFFKYLISAFLSFIIDILLFSWFLKIIDINSNILAATILARTVSSIYNYITYSKLIFKDMNIISLSKYYVLAIIQMFVSGCFVTYIYSLLNINILIIKIFVDFILWVINLIIQRKFVFKGDKL